MNSPESPLVPKAGCDSGLFETGCFGGLFIEKCAKK